MKKSLRINGVATTVMVDPGESLANVLRMKLGLAGTKVRCGRGQCGRCSVILDGEVVRSCMTVMEHVPEGASITTVEGVGSPANPHPVQLALVGHGEPQCGYCMPGIVVSAKALLDQSPNPSRDEVRAWLQKHGNACRCHGNKPIVEAVMDAAKVLRGEMPVEALGGSLGSAFLRLSAVLRPVAPVSRSTAGGSGLEDATNHTVPGAGRAVACPTLDIDTIEAERTTVA